MRPFESCMVIYGTCAITGAPCAWFFSHSTIAIIVLICESGLSKMSIGVNVPRRSRVVFLDQDCPARQHEDVIVGKDEAVAVRWRHRHASHLPGAAFLDQLELLRTSFFWRIGRNPFASVA